MTMQTYTIGQALRRIKKVKGEIAKQNERITAALVYKKEEEPAFPYEDSVDKRDKARKELILLSTGVAVANANNRIKIGDDLVPLAGVIRILTEIKAEIAEYQSYRVYGLRSRAHSNIGLRNKRETVDVEKVEEFEDISDGDGNYKGQRKVIREKKTTVISNLTEPERAEAIEKLEAKFEELNNALERANNSIVFEVELEAQ